jgi:hypothetical protein
VKLQLATPPLHATCFPSVVNVTFALSGPSGNAQFASHLADPLAVQQSELDVALVSGSELLRSRTHHQGMTLFATAKVGRSRVLNPELPWGSLADRYL